MKRTVLIALAFGLCLTGFAQKSQIRSAVNYLNDKDYVKAKAAIETAVNDESTKNDPKAWYTRGVIYMAMQAEPANENSDMYKEAGKSFLKAVSLDPAYEKEDMNNKLFAVAIYNFNDGLTTYSKQAYGESYNNFGNVVAIYELEGSKRFAANKKFDTIAHQSGLYQGYTAYYDNKYDLALPALIKAKNDPIVADPNIYLFLADIYESKADNAALASVIAEGRKLYPDNKSLANRELNYYIKSGNTTELLAKLEAAVQNDPNNPDLMFALGVTYDNLANPKDKTGNDLPKPAKYDEYFNNAERVYLNASKVAPDKTDLNFNAGALYFNRAVLVNTQMNAITGSTPAELKKYDALKAERETWFGKALPYLEKAYTNLDARASSLSPEDKSTYQASIVALKEIYAKQNKFDKSAEMKKKLEDSRK
jgi:Tfp pilus assembly protein PilF